MYIHDKNKEITMAVAEAARQVMVEDSEMVNESNSFPTSVEYKGKTYWKTGKKGTHIKSEEESVEYQHIGRNGNTTDQRVWRTKSGKIEED